MSKAVTQKIQTIPLVRADLTHADAQAVRWQLATAPFQDEALLNRWEAAWEAIWHRSAVAFSGPVALMLALKAALGWGAGDWVGVDPLLDPAWGEALTAAWLRPAWRDVDPDTGEGEGAFAWDPAEGGVMQAGMGHHPYGLPLRRPVGGPSFWLEDLSALLLPISGCGWGDVQIFCFSGNRMVAAGGSALLLTQDVSLGCRLRALRRHPPAPLACALGLSQLRTLVERLARRQELAVRYHRLLRGRSGFQLPEERVGLRVWERFLLRMASETEWASLKTFLNKSNVHAESPLWFKPANISPLPGLNHFQTHMLALPLYASLADTDQKRLINRVNRWVARNEREKTAG